MPRLDVLVVLYRCGPQDSATIRSLAAQAPPDGQARLTVWDNSPEAMGDPSALAPLRRLFGQVDYIHSPGNTPLSRVYNRFLSDRVAETALILDQDSVLPADYLSVLMDHLARHPEIALFVPRVHAQGSLVSPGRFGAFKGRALRDMAAGITPSAGHTIITSGMALRKTVFDHGLRFNDDLWLYAVDTDFFLRFRERYPCFSVLPLDVAHGSALRSDMTPEQRLFRFRNLRWSHLTMLRSLGRDGVRLRVYLLYLSLRHAVRYRSVRFLLGWKDNGRR